MFEELWSFIRERYPDDDTIPLHAPMLGDLEKQALNRCIDSGFVSSVGPLVSEFESALSELTNSRFVIATVNGTSALQLALAGLGVGVNDEVVTQALTFIATANSIRYAGAEPVFIDIQPNGLSLCPKQLKQWLVTHTEQINGRCINRDTKRIVKACLCMHTFGHPARLEALKAVCDEFGLALVEDGAQSLGSYYQHQPVGCYGQCGTLSFNGNKIITTGGGGAVLTNDEQLAKKLRHLATTAKIPHAYEGCHDEMGYNFRMPSLNAALGCAQLSRFTSILASKRQLALSYQDFFANSDFEWVGEPSDCQSNYWLNAVLCGSKAQARQLLDEAIAANIHMRPAWQLLTESPMYKNCQRGELSVSKDIAGRLVNLPSSPSIQGAS